MSDWTHVAAVVRIDDFRFGGSADDAYFDKLFGRQCLWTSDHDIWEYAAQNPEEFLPMGSEGSLQKTVWINPEEHHLDAYTVTIFGDLRDYDDAISIVKWFKSICDKIVVRQATITVDTGYSSITYTYSEADKLNPSWDTKLKLET